MRDGFSNSNGESERQSRKGSVAGHSCSLDASEQLRAVVTRVHHPSRPSKSREHCSVLDRDGKGSIKAVEPVQASG